ncbi:hypothetical protein EPO44_02845 [bacterium]|nr:MAG: hypothetical protein EPO44_02845 [bacterium]
MEQMRKKILSLLGPLLILLTTSHVQAYSIFGDEVENFLKERVSFGGFVENATGLSVSHGDRHFNTSNRLDMQRFTIQPEFQVNATDWAKLFISWRFVKEIRYSAEAKSREKSVSYFPPVPVKPLPNTFYDEDSFKPWEAVLDLFPTDLLKIRLGRQFISWGETDGIRLLDVINPQDLTFSPPAAPNLFNLDETRIPSWGLRTLYTIRPVSNTIFEFFALPGFWDQAKQRVDEVVGANDTGDLKVRYGRWSAHPETRLVLAGRNAFGNLFANPINPVLCQTATPTKIGCLVIPSTSRELPDAGDSWKIGTRITSSVGKLNFGLGYIWGFNPQSTDMVFKLKGVRCSSPIAAACAGGAAPSVANLRLVNDRTNIFAGHFNYPLGDVLSVPVNTTVRGEMAFLPDKPYNISRFPGAFGLKASADPKHPSGVVEKNTLRYALGFDRTTLIPFLHLDDPWRAFSLSFQIFQSIIFNHEDGIHPFSTAEKINRVSTTFTFRIGTGYAGDTIIPDLFLGYDPDGYWTANPAISYVPPWNEKVRLSLIGAFYGGHNKFKSFGFFDEKDSVFLKMRYQF